MRPSRALLAFLVSACSTAFDSNSGGDHVRGKAVEIKLGQTHDDFLSAEQGDNPDWKKLIVAEPAMLGIHAYWDEPSILATVVVKDQFGGKVFELQHERGKPADHWTGMKMRAGEYYLEVVATRGASVYTLEVLEEGDAPAGGDDTAPPE